MVEPISTALAGLSLLKKSVDFIKSNISTAKDIGDIINHVDAAMNAEQQIIKERDRKGDDPFAVENVAKSVLDARIARENLQEVKLLIEMRFPGAWGQILAERKRRIEAKKQAIKEAKAKKIKKMQEIEEYVKYGFIALATVLFIAVSIGITIKFFVSVTNKVYAHNIEYDDGSCRLYEPKLFLICMQEGRAYADTELYLDYKKNRGNWIVDDEE
tara:strand:+ start:703 stop:1347 length:645 start_codon:yes stop_codon:yes gene_type:complete